jgi:hypothetical protein
MMHARPRYYVIKRGRGYWQPTTQMRARGCQSVACGVDGLEARALAEEWNTAWDIMRRGAKASDTAIAAAGFAPEEFEAVRADAALNDVWTRVQCFARSSAAAHLAKGLRRFARAIERDVTRVPEKQAA